MLLTWILQTRSLQDIVKVQYRKTFTSSSSTSISTSSLGSSGSAGGGGSDSSSCSSNVSSGSGVDSQNTSGYKNLTYLNK